MTALLCSAAAREAGIDEALAGSFLAALDVQLTEERARVEERLRKLLLGGSYGTAREYARGVLARQGHGGGS